MTGDMGKAVFDCLASVISGYMLIMYATVNLLHTGLETWETVQHG